MNTLFSKQQTLTSVALQSAIRASGSLSPCQTLCPLTARLAFTVKPGSKLENSNSTTAELRYQDKQQEDAALLVISHLF